MRITSFLLPLLILPYLVQSQQQTIEYKELLSASANDNNGPIISAFSGGFNTTIPAHADINGDGKKDLVVFDYINNLLKTYINIGGQGDELYKYDPYYLKNFPPISSYIKFVDYNCDNVPDLIHRGNSGVSVHPGYYDNGELKFTFYKELYYPGLSGPENCYVWLDDIPIIRDVDNDGDIDVVAFDGLGTRPAFYQNLQVENNAPCDSMIMSVNTWCWGQMWQSVFRYYVLNGSCKGFTGSNKKYRHPANCILAMDINNNGLLDFIGGNGSFSDAQVVFNGGTATNAFFTSQDTTLDLNGHQLELHSWPAPFYFDIDNDNDNDLIFSAHTDNLFSANYNSMAIYENTGTATNTNFVFKNDSALIKSTIDIGRNSHPTLFDYNKDGKLDLFIGGEGFFNTISKKRNTEISYYKNTSTTGAVSFELMTKDFLNLKNKNYTGLYPTFGDITGDGIDDLVMGTDSGQIIVYKNQATSNSVPPNFVWLSDSLQQIDIGDYSFPILYDFNNDGKKDLLIGNEMGALALYHDTSMVSGSKAFKRIDSAVGNVSAGGHFAFLSFAVPYIGRVDSSNKEHLLVGNSEGTIERYDSFTNRLNNWVQLDSQMAKIQTGFRSAPAVGDLDGDQRPELIVGNQNGGINIYQFVKNLPNTNVGVIQINNSKRQISIFPNPAKNKIWIKYQESISAIQGYRIYDISGRIIQAQYGFMNINEGIDIGALNNGIYYLQIQHQGVYQSAGKFFITDH